MARHMVAYELSGSEAALTALTPVPDGTVALGSASDIRVPIGMNNLGFAAAMINSATATLRAQIQTPSLNGLWPHDISPISNGLVFGSIPRCNKLWANPIKLVENESMRAFAQNGAAVMNRVLAEFVDGPVKPVQGPILTIRATAAATLATASWANSALTFASVLPAGTYQLVGARAWSANSVAARFFFNGGIWRPGLPTVNAEDQNENIEHRYGGLGVWGQFTNLTPPTVDIFGITDTAESFFLDLIKVQ